MKTYQQDQRPRLYRPAAAVWLLALTGGLIVHGNPARCQHVGPAVQPAPAPSALEKPAADAADTDEPDDPDDILKLAAESL